MTKQTNPVMSKRVSKLVIQPRFRRTNHNIRREMTDTWKNLKIRELYMTVDLAVDNRTYFRVSRVFDPLCYETGLYY